MVNAIMVSIMAMNIITVNIVMMPVTEEMAKIDGKDLSKGHLLFSLVTDMEITNLDLISRGGRGIEPAGLIEL